MFPYVYRDSSTTCPLQVPRDKNIYKARMYKLLSDSILGQYHAHLIPEVLVYLADGDLATKKMACLFISRIRTFREEMFLVVNTLMQYCEHSNPVIKSLALKTIVSLQQECIAEMVSAKCMECLDCKNPFVRRVAVLGCAKLYRQWNCLRDRRKNLLAKLYSMLEDPDIIVALNAMHAIEDIFYFGFIPDRRTAIRMSNNLKNYPSILRPWLLRYLFKYDTDNADDAVALMNSLDNFLVKGQQRPCIPAALLPIFVKLVDKHIPNCISQVGIRFRESLCNCLTVERREMAYAVVCSIQTTLKVYVTAYRKSYTLFFWRLDEPPYLQQEKLSVLQELANLENLKEVLSNIKSMFEVEMNETTLDKGIRVLSHFCTYSQSRAPSVDLLLKLIRSKRTSTVISVKILTELLKQCFYIKSLGRRMDVPFLAIILTWIENPSLSHRSLTLAIFYLGERILWRSEPTKEDEDEVPAAMDEGEERLELDSKRRNLFDITIMKLSKLLEEKTFFEFDGTTFKLYESMVPVLGAMLTTVEDFFSVNPSSCQSLLIKIVQICCNCDDPMLRTRGFLIRSRLEEDEDGSAKQNEAQNNNFGPRTVERKSPTLTQLGSSVRRGMY